MKDNQTTQRGCPLTGGAEIRMTQGAWDRCCQAKKAEAIEEQRKNHHLSRASGFLFSSPCLDCSGPPAELTIITIDQAMITERKPRAKQAAPLAIAAPWTKAKEPDHPQPAAKPAEKVVANPQEKPSQPRVPTMNNKIGDLNDHLFAQLERLSDEKLKGDDLEKEIARSKAVTNVAGSIIACGALALKARLALDKDLRPEQLPKMLEG